jgi:hypothetical protein
MRLERTMRRCVVGLTAALMSVTNVYAGGPVQGFRGHWSVHVHQYCAENFSPAVGGFDCRSAGRDLTFTEDLQTNSTGARSFQFEDRTLYRERGVSGEPPPVCDATLYEHGNSRVGGVVTVVDARAHPYTWQCLVTSRGIGLFRLGYTHLTDFWIARETVTFQGNGAVRRIYNPRSVLAQRRGHRVYPVDLGYPAVPGRYGTRQLLNWEGLSHVLPPPHYAIQLSVAHRR